MTSEPESQPDTSADSALSTTTAASADAPRSAGASHTNELDQTTAATTRLSPMLAIGTAVSALIALLIGRMLSRALPGSRTGIGEVISATNVAAAVVTHLFVIAAVAVTLRLIVVLLKDKRMAPWQRAISGLASAIVVALVVASAQRALPSDLTLVLGVAAVSLSLVAVGPMLTWPSTRGAGLVLGCVGIAAALHIAARYLVIESGDRPGVALFQAARILASLSAVADVASLSLAAIWIARERSVGRWLLLVAGAGVSLVVAWGALVGTQPGAALWQVLAARGLGEVLGVPAPHLTRFARYWIEFLALVIAAVTLSGRSKFLATSVALALIARRSPDVPVLGLAVSVSALLGQLLASAEMHLSEKTTE